jgi:putative component of membrane protein insertase Oxa1/YidC/SpoIIIJ protein YidD
VLLQGFSREFLAACGAFVSTGIGDVPAGFGHARMTGTSCVRCTLGGVVVRRAPEPGPVRGDRGELSVLFQTRPRRPLAGRRVRFPQPPSIGSRIADSSSSCYRVVQVDAHAPFDKGWLMFWRLVRKRACAGLLGGARSRSLGAEGAEALPRWDPPD